MASINILKGDFGKGFGTVSSDYMSIPSKSGVPEKVKLTQIKSIKTEKMMEKRRWGRTAAFGATGGLLFGPVGLVGGALLGGNKTIIKCEIQLKDKKKFSAEIEEDVFRRLLKYAK